MLCTLISRAPVTSGSVLGSLLGSVLSDVDLVLDVLEELRGHQVGSVVVRLKSGLSHLVVVVRGAEASCNVLVSLLVSNGTTERDSIHVGPGHVVA